MPRRRCGRAVPLAAALVLIPSFLPAQVPPLDSARQRYHDVLWSLRDTVGTVLAASWEFNRDLSAAGAETVLARAAVLAERCRGVGRALEDARPTFQPRQALPATREAARGLLQALDRLAVSLRDDCERGFGAPAPTEADSVRAWGPYRLGRLERAARDYETAARRFAGAAGFRLEPKM